MGRPRPHGKAKRGRETKPDEQRAIPLPALLTYDPYLVKLTRRIEDAKEESRTRRRQ